MSTVEIDGVLYDEVDSDLCDGCAFRLINNECGTPDETVSCGRYFRTDRRDVIFIRIDPQSVHIDRDLLQRAIDRLYQFGQMELAERLEAAL